MRTRGRAAPRGRVRDFSGRFAWDILGILKTGGTPHADRDVRVQKHKGFATFLHRTFKNTMVFNDFGLQFSKMALSRETSSKNASDVYSIL